MVALTYEKTELKKVNIYELRENDVFLHAGIEYIFGSYNHRRSRMGGINVHATRVMDNTKWKLGMHTTATVERIGRHTPVTNSVTVDPRLLKPGELFVIVGTKKPEVYRFESMKPNGGVRARNPIDNGIMNIGQGFEFIKIDNLPY